ncbi:hypothetical protein JCM8202_006308 [Rhodotorula sphaerocarpa]
MTASIAPLSVPALLPSPSAPPARRTDLVSLKLRLAELLPPEHGALYWNGLADFFTGRINRAEWDEVMRRAFGRDRSRRQQALKLHNALVLSIVYNTTRPYLPPTSVRHSGFHPRGAKKRARDPAYFGAAGEGEGGPVTELELKRQRLVKETVMALGRRERGEVKLLGAAGAGVAGAGASAAGGGGRAGAAGAGSKTKGQLAAAEEERRRKRRAAEAISEAVDGTSRGGGGAVTAEGVPEALLTGGKDPTSLAALAVDYNRLLQAPLCCESRILPDGDTLHDRMLAVGYEEGLASGVEGRAAGLLSGAMDHHLQNMIASVIALTRGTRNAVPPLLDPSSAASPTSTFAPAGAAPSAPSPTAKSGKTDAAQEPKSPPNDADADDANEEEDRRPLTIADFHALFAISPSLLGQHPNIAAVERMYAIAPQDSDSESDEYDSDEEEENMAADPQAQASAQAAAAPARRVTIDASAKKEETTSNAVGTPSSGTGSTGVGAGKHPRLSRSRASSFYGINRPVPVSSPATSASTSASATSTHGNPAPSKGRFVIDPSSRHGVPEGHPSVPPLPSTPQTLLPSWLGGSTSSYSAAAGTGASAGNNPAGAGGAAAAASAAGGPAGADLSPKSLALRNSLFPELASSSAAAASSGAAGASGPGSAGRAAAGEAHAADGNATSTDAGDSDSDDEAAAVLKKGAAAAASSNAGEPKVPLPPPTTSTGTGLKIKFGGGTVQGGTPQQQQQQQQPGGAAGGPGQDGQQRPGEANDRESGRKLWEVVDSVGLLDGVLPP